MAGNIFSFLGKGSRSLNGWGVLSWFWLANLLTLAVIIGFRAIKTSGIAQTFEFDDVPLLYQLDHNYPWLMLAMGVSGAVVGGFFLFGYLSARSDNRPVPVSLVFRLGMMWGLGLIACRFVQPISGAGVEIEPVGVLDWLVLLLACSNAWSMLDWIAQETQRPEWPEILSQSPPEHRMVRLSVVYLLGCASVSVYAILEHMSFWDKSQNGGYDYRLYFQSGEIEQANWLFYSTSLLFATLAALAGCVAFVGLRAISRSESSRGRFFTQTDARRQASVLAGCWSAALTIPWQVKILPEIIANDGWILPAISLGMTSAGLMPLLMASGLLMRRDFQESAHRSAVSLRIPVYPRRSEMALWNFLLFPVYPLLRLLFPKRSPGFVRTGGLLIFTAGMIGALTWVFQKVDDLFDFDDWRGMLNEGLFPCLQVLMSLLAAAWIYLAGSRALAWLHRKMVLGSQTGSPSDWVAHGVGTLVRMSVVVCAMAVLGVASWPFWGWDHISENTFARAVEFNDRHEFELRFLHWLFDADRDGYASVLHGADADDSNPAIQAGGLAAPEVVPVPIDEFDVVEPGKARNFPNVAIFFLEGVTCRTISAYGERNLPDGLVATPNIDSVAKEGTRFTNARCYYPSTWDGWFAVNSGRYLRIAEMHAGSSFGDRYSRYNNLYKVLKLAGINRWCHADVAPFYDLFVPEDLRGREPTAWKSEDKYDSSVSAEEEDRGIWRGDKRAKRITDFLDSLKPGERFFFCEHMSDTHFPWERTSEERAAELGFPDGLKIYEADATLPNGGTHGHYSRYLQTITRMDGQIGTILKKLKEKNLYDNTMIVIVSDHGCQWFEHDHMYYVSHLYEQSLHIPMIIKYPGLPGGRVSEEPVLQIDVVPTIAELAGVKHTNPRSDYPMTCQSLVPLLSGSDQADSGRYQNRDMLLCTHYDTLGVISHFEHKLIFDRPTGTMMVFDLKHDPGETKNLADTRPDLRAMLLKKLRFLTRRHASFIGQIQASEHD